MENLVIELIMGWTSVHQNVKDMVELYLRHCLTYHQHHHGLILFQMWPVEVEKRHGCQNNLKVFMLYLWES
jgi:hypothetical protein